MSTYVDGFVLAVPTANLDAYQVMSQKASEVWKDHGALDYRECVGDDLNIEGMRSFIDVAGAKEGETVVFAYIVFNSREHRDEVNAKVMADPRLGECGDPEKMPFDCKRMAYGGFRTIVSL